MTSMAKHELSKLEALTKAQAYCARAEHCAADVRRKLYEWQIDPDLFDFIEKNLYENDYLNDARFCSAYVHDKIEYQRWGRLKIQAGLRALQLPEREIQEAIKTIDERVYTQNIRHLAASRRTASYEQQMRYLLQRGFTLDEIKNT